MPFFEGFQIRRVGSQRGTLSAEKLRFKVPCNVAYLETFGRWVPPLHLKKISHGHPTTERSKYVISVSPIFVCIRSLLVYNVELL